MKRKRCIPILLILCTLCLSNIQGQESSDIYYSYEMVDGQAISDGDTAYQVFILIDSLEILEYEKLVILNDAQEKVISIKPKDLEKENKLTRDGTKYRIDLDRWTDTHTWIVFGEKADKAKKYFKSLDEKEKEKEKEKLIHFPIPVNRAPSPDTTVVNN